MLFITMSGVKVRLLNGWYNIALGIDMNGHKDVLGMYVGKNESAKFWLSIMNRLKKRGVKDILIACVDGVSGYPEAIRAAFPKTEVQHCMVHQIRNSTKFVSYKDLKPLMSDLRHIYAVPTEGDGTLRIRTLRCFLEWQVSKDL